MLSPKTKRNIAQIIPFGLIWMVSGFAYSFIEKGLLGDLDSYPVTGDAYDFKVTFLIMLIALTGTGLLVGFMEVRYLNNLFAKKGFGKKILYKSLIYVGMLVALFVTVYPISRTLEFHASIFDQEIWDSLWAYLTNFSFMSVMVYAALTMGVSLFYFEMSQSIGHRVLLNYFTGKYHTPTEEERLFMFLDMKSSTTIAEKLGHDRYFEMLREYYADLTKPIIEYSGEIYQYVGDEVVISWKNKTGLHKNNCIQCFFAMKKELNDEAEKYSSIFGVVPTFKAGLHLGKVTTGEVGVIKKEIVFTGDVLNTTARIQGLCNHYKVDLLVSDDLVKELAPDATFQVKSLGKSELRGRKENIGLSTIF